MADFHKHSLPKATLPLCERMGDIGNSAIFFDINDLLEIQYSYSQPPIGINQTIQPCGEMPLWTNRADLALKKEVSDWLKMFDVDYYLDIRPYFSNCGSAIIIFDPSKAAMFKLTWL